MRRLNLFGDAVGDPNRLISLDADELLAVAQQSTGLTNSSSDDDWDTGYRQLVEHLDARAGLTVLGRLSARAEIIRNLQTRLRLADYWRAHPDVFDEEIVEPVFILGPPRTGTSILLELLARDPGLRPVVAHEAHFPLGPLPVWTGLRQRFPSRNRSSGPTSTPTSRRCMNCVPTSCECVHFVQPEFRSWHWSMMFDLNDVPGRTTPEANQAIYRFHRQFLQTLQHRDGHRSRFLLKTPAHLGFLPELFETYPDARYLHASRSAQIHRVVRQPHRRPALDAIRRCRPVDSGPDHGGGLRDPARRGDATTHRRRSSSRADH